MNTPIVTRTAVQNRIVKVQKRNRALVRFDEGRIIKALLRAADSIGDLLDQQIIDAQGRKVVRVTDVTFEIRAGTEWDSLHVQEVDIGLRSVLRRLAVIRVAQRMGLPLSVIADAFGHLPAAKAPTVLPSTRWTSSRRFTTACDGSGA